MQSRKIIASLVLVAMTAACAGRDPSPVMPMAWGNEQNLTCQGLYAEMNANNVRIASLHQEEDNKRGQNIAMGAVALVLFWPAVFAMDFKDAAGKDRANLEVRQAYLQSLYGQKSCANGAA